MAREFQAATHIRAGATPDGGPVEPLTILFSLITGHEDRLFALLKPDPYQIPRATIVRLTDRDRRAYSSKFEQECLVRQDVRSAACDNRYDHSTCEKSAPASALPGTIAGFCS